MCIIITCDAGRRPSYDTILNSFAANPDGAGLAWIEGGSVQTSKGYFDSYDYMQAIDNVPKDSPLLLHMRIGTSGGYDADVTHPFPITKSVDVLHALDVSCPIAVAHNGVLPYKGDVARHISDTMEYIRTVLVPLSKNRIVRANGGLARSHYARVRIADTSRGSKIALIDAGGQVARIGKGWVTVSDGIYASNQSYRRYDGWLTNSRWDDGSGTAFDLDSDAYNTWGRDYDAFDDGYYLSSRYGGWYDDIED